MVRSIRSLVPAEGGGRVARNVQGARGHKAQGDEVGAPQARKAPANQRRVGRVRVGGGKKEDGMMKKASV